MEYLCVFIIKYRLKLYLNILVITITIEAPILVSENLYQDRRQF